MINMISDGLDMSRGQYNGLSFVEIVVVLLYALRGAFRGAWVGVDA